MTAPTQDPKASAKGCGCLAFLLLAVLGMVRSAFFPSADEQCREDLTDLLSRTGGHISWSDTNKIHDMCEDGDWTNDR